VELPLASEARRRLFNELIEANDDRGETGYKCGFRITENKNKQTKNVKYDNDITFGGHIVYLWPDRVSFLYHGLSYRPRSNLVQK